ncbi:hypothetical protein C1646_767034 [Rhizophagus diaphanus]|nr:hypothetical protein C1646_767034 [Rhizophagus diaphanus] [Rhizophagus sp. MUCL 43196]
MPKHTIRRSDNKQTKSVRSEPSSSNTRKLVACYCDQCNGKKVDPRTRRKHQLKPATQPSKKHKVLIISKKPEINSSSSSSSSTSLPNDDKERYQETKKTRKRYDQFHSTDIEINQGEEPILSSRSSNDDDGKWQSADNKDVIDDEEDLSYDKDYRNLSEHFSALNLNDMGPNLDPEAANFDDLWILL